ncbi:HI1506-related protein [Halomonas sp. M1]|uniref:HI1506-related protein n=1 Tax=Halomonas sp. M1 TaxID=3035470 RepID=UPI002486C46A|nr:HI1506-related protein [Halomonas sp. M1]WFE73104.1 HI1506-related protein [Halomonas sp. M1]
MTTRKQSAAAKAKQEKVKAEATEAQPQEQVEPTPETPETPADAVAPCDEQEAKASEDGAATVEAAQTEATQPTETQGNTVTGDGTGKALPPIEEMPGVFVRTKRRIKSRRRAGFRFNREGTGIALVLLSEEQLQQLRDDPALEVEDCDFPLTEATSEPEA